MKKLQRFRLRFLSSVVIMAVVSISLALPPSDASAMPKTRSFSELGFDLAPKEAGSPVRLPAVGVVNVDNTASNGAATGYVVDDSQWPTVYVKVKNQHDYWTQITVFSRDADVTVEPAAGKGLGTLAAELGYIFPQAEAQYKLVFSESRNARVHFFVNAGRSLDGFGANRACFINLFSEILSTLGLWLTASNAESILPDIVAGAEHADHLVRAADALVNLNLVGAAKEFERALGSDKELEIITNIGSKLGLDWTVGYLKAFFSVRKIYDAFKHSSDLVFSILTGSYSGSVLFESEVNGLPQLPPPPIPTPPSPEPTPAPPTADVATLVSDVTLSAGTVVTPGQALVKTWRVRNSGSSTWDGYQLIFLQGDQMGGNSPVSIPRTTPGQQIDISVNLRARRTRRAQRPATGRSLTGMAGTCLAGSCGSR